MMTAKFAGRCVLCHGDILVGSPINWAKGFGASHLAGMCSVQPVVATPPSTLSAPATVLANASAIVALLNFAKSKGLKMPKLRFLAPDGKSEMRLSLAGGNTKYPGAVQVKVNGEWKGRINADGSLTPNMVRDGFVGTLTTIAADPAAAAKAYGSLMCKCSVCNLPLTDAGSVEVGYGPICADRMGWPHTPKGTPALHVAPLTLVAAHV